MTFKLKGMDERKQTIDLTGPEGNAFSLIGNSKKSCEKVTL